MASASDIKDILLAVKDLIAVTVPFLSIWITHEFMAKRDDDRYTKDFKQRRIDEFYGPMLSMIIELRGRKKAYEEIIVSVAANTEEEHEGNFSKDKKDQSDTGVVVRRKEFSDQADAMLEESDKELLKSMQSLYREKLWMAEPSTVDLFQSFIALTEISSLNSKEFASWQSLDTYARKSHLFEEIEKDLHSNKERLLNELDLS